jgi:hypothetical protein
MCIGEGEKGDAAADFACKMQAYREQVVAERRAVAGKAKPGVNGGGRS